MVHLGVFRSETIYTVEHLSRQQFSPKSSIIDVRLGSKYTSDCFPKDISLTYYSDLLCLLESEIYIWISKTGIFFETLNVKVF